jgi:hypothetical protein
MTYIPKPNNYAESRPTVILMDFPEGDDALDGYPQGLSVVADDDNKPIAFKNFSKAKKYVTNNIDASIQRYVRFANEVPVEGGGDREATNNRKCIKCKGFLRPGMTHSNYGFEYTEQVCPKCDKER